MRASSGRPCLELGGNDMRSHYEQMIRDTEKRALSHLKTQNLDRNSPYYGAFVMPNGVYMQKHALYCIADIGAVYCNAES